jgi:hypothetical protein
MQMHEFLDTLDDDSPPVESSPLLVALWHDHQGDWEKAHDIAQGISSSAGSRVHAYLHRKEGDLRNADYWYRRAGIQRPDMSLHKEWQGMVKSFTE